MTHALPLSLLAGLAAAPLAAQDAATTLTADRGAKEFVIETGPVDLPLTPHGDGHHHGDEGMVYPPIAEVTFPFDAYLYGFRYEFVDAQGNVLPSALMHHLNVIDPNHRDLFLPISYRMAAVGSETGAMALPRYLFGQPVAAGQSVVISSMLHNPTGQAYEGVTLRFSFDYMPAGRPWPLFGVRTFQLDVAFPAGDKDFDLPPGRSSFSWEGSPVVAGRIVAIGGHLHEHAVNLTLEDMTTGALLWEGRPVLDDEGRLAGVTVGYAFLRLGIKLYPTHRYRATVTYDNPTGGVIPDGGMGLVGGLFIPSVREWPAADRSNPLYVLDRAHYMREVRGKLAELIGDSTVTTSAASEDHQSHNH